MKRFLFTLLAVFSILSAQAQAGDEPAFDRVSSTKTIRCGYFSWPPYMAKDPNTGVLSGINYDIMTAIGAFLDLKIEWTADIGVGETVTALNAGKFDVMCASLWPDPARIQNMELSDATFYSAVYAFTRAGDTRFDGDLSKANKPDIKIATIDGDTGAYLAQEKLPSAGKLALPQTASGAEILLQIVSKKADLALVDEALVNDFLKSNPGTLRKVQNIPPVRIFGEHLAVQRGEYHLRDMMNLALLQLINDGEIAKITAKYRKIYKSAFLPPSPLYQTPSP